MVSIDPKTAGTISPPVLDRISEFSILTSVEKGDGYRPAAPSRRLLREDPPLRAPYQANEAGDILRLAQSHNGSAADDYRRIPVMPAEREKPGPGLKWTVLDPDLKRHLRRLLPSSFLLTGIQASEKKKGIWVEFHLPGAQVVRLRGESQSGGQTVRWVIATGLDIVETHDAHRSLVGLQIGSQLVPFTVGPKRVLREGSVYYGDGDIQLVYGEESRGLSILVKGEVPALMKPSPPPAPVAPPPTKKEKARTAEARAAPSPPAARPTTASLLTAVQIRTVQGFITHFQLRPDNFRTIMTLEDYLPRAFLRAIGTRFPNLDNVFNDISRSVTDLDLDSRAAGFPPMSEAFLAVYMAIATDLYIGHNLWLATQAKARGASVFDFDREAAKEIFSTAYRSAIFVMEGPDSPRLTSVTRFQVGRVLGDFEELNRDAPIAVRDVLVQEDRFPVTVAQLKDRLAEYLRRCWAALPLAPGSFETGPLIDVLEQEAVRRVEAFLQDDGWTNAYPPYMDHLTAVAMIRLALALAPRGPLFIPAFSDNDPVIVDLNRYLEDLLEDGAIMRETFPWAVAIAMGGTRPSPSELITAAEWRALRGRLNPGLRAALPERPPRNLWALEGRLNAYYKSRVLSPLGEVTMVMGGIFGQLVDLTQNGEPMNPAFRIIYTTLMIERLGQIRESFSGGGSSGSDMDKFIREIVPSLAGASIPCFRATRRLLGRTDPAFNREELTLIARLVLSDLQKHRGGLVQSPFLDTFLAGNAQYPRTPVALRTLIDTHLAGLPSPPPPVTTILGARLLKESGGLAHVVEAAIGMYNTAFLIEAAVHTDQGAEGADAYQKALQAAARYSTVFCKDVLGLDGVEVSPHPRYVPPASAIDRTAMARTQFIDPSYLEAALNEVGDPRLVGVLMIGGYPETFAALDERLTAYMYERLRGISSDAGAIASGFETVCSVAEQGRYASASPSQAALMRVLYVNAALEKPRAFVAAWETGTSTSYLMERVPSQAIARAEAYVSERNGVPAELRLAEEAQRGEGEKATESLLRDLLKPEGKK